MASHGNRTKPALYKPTDFTSQQKKAQMRGESSENKKSSEEGKVSTGKTENSENEGSMKKVTILKPPQSKVTKSDSNPSDSPTSDSPIEKPETQIENPKPQSENPKPQSETSESQSETSEPQSETPEPQSEKPAEKVEKTGKPAKQASSKAQVEEKPHGVADKDFDRIQKLREFMEKQQLADQAATAKTSKEVKDKEEPSKQDGSQKKDQEKKDTKTNRNQRNNRSNIKGKTWIENSPKKVPPTGGKHSASGARKSQPADGKAKEKNNDTSSGGAKPKHGVSKADSAPTDKSTATQRPTKDGNQNPKKGNANYHQRNFNGPNNQRLPNNNTSILGNPYQQPPPSLTAPPPQPKQQTFVPPSPGLTSIGKSNKPHIIAPASKDKKEHKRSLDFVKNFFDTDPEVLYHRKKNAEKGSTSNTTTQVQNALSTTTVSPSVPSANSHMSTENEIANFLTNHHYGGHGNQNPGSLLPQNIPMPLSMTSNYSNFNNFYHQQSPHNHLGHGGASNTSQGSSASVQQRQQQQQQLRSSPGPFHSIGPGSIPQSHHQQQQQQQQQQQRNFDMYSSMNQNALHHAQQPGAHFPVRSHATSQPNNPQSNNYNNMLNSYSNYFPAGSNPHVFHVQQDIDASVMSSILDDPKKPKKWQQRVLNKCGPIDSQQARSLIEELIDGSYECMVCCDSIKYNNAVWSCSNCFHIFHLHCIRKWAKSEAASVKDQNGWRCPGCQNISTRPPNKYFCFCGKVRDPDWTPRDGITPHSCGEVCKKKRTCNHNCIELCHPGPCPSCPVMVTKHCFCGKTSTKVRCGLTKPITCENECLKLLQCGQHQCSDKCHQGPCKECEIKLLQECFCGREKRQMICGTGEVLAESLDGAEGIAHKTFSCEKSCERILACGNHLCEDSCHLGDCSDCPLLPENVQTCPCKKVDITTLLGDEKRTSCLDPVPTCDSFCGRKLPCGRLGSSHLCMMKCHEGPCKPCSKSMEIQCRCNGTKKEVACKDMKPDELLQCDRKCTKKRRCGRHKCNQKCCVDKEHNCNIICGKKLSCGQHKCDEVCHAGFCPTCWRAGFDELSCHCGATVLYPPIPCGAKPPECNQPCARPHTCGHPPLHPCHSDETCPPCAVLTTKHCMGGHQVWKNVPCHQEEVSCGQKCAKPLKCGMHKCIKTCHKGQCLAEEEACQQKCLIHRADCTHPCSAPCHVGFKCPETTCKVQISITCRCRRKTATAICMAGNLQSAYQSFNAEILTMQLQNLQSGQAIDISGLTNPEKRPKFLDCDEECGRLERNKRFVEALNIEAGEDGNFQCLIYSDSLKQDARLRLPFIQNLEVIFENLSLAAKRSSQQQAIHNFPPMNSAQRKIVHELAECYGFKSYSVDQEPKRSTVVHALKESYVPTIKLSQLVENEMKNMIPSSLVRRDSTDSMSNPQNATERKTLKSILKQPSQQPPSAAAKRVNYFDDDFQE